MAVLCGKHDRYGNEATLRKYYIRLEFLHEAYSLTVALSLIHISEILALRSAANMAYLAGSASKQAQALSLIHICNVHT